MFITKKHIPRRAVLRAAGVTLGLPFLEAMIPAGTAFRANCCRSQAANGLFLSSSRRDHGQHLAWSGDG